jgi:U3 small nucleolar RNA-associated protein 11
MVSRADETVDAYGAEEETEAAQAEEEETADLGWLAPEPSKKKKKTKAKVEPEPEAAPEDTTDEARVSDSHLKLSLGPADTQAHRMEQLGHLSALLGRVRILRQAEARLETTKALMGKGAARKVREAGLVDDENAKEDRNGERKTMQSKQWKWKLERRK